MRKTVLFLLLFIQFCATAAAQNVVSKVIESNGCTLSYNIIEYDGGETETQFTSLRVSENNRERNVFYDENGDYVWGNYCDTLIVEEGVDTLWCDNYSFRNFQIIKFPQSLKEFEGRGKVIGASSVFCPWQDPISIGDLRLKRSTGAVLVVQKGRVEAYKNSDWGRYFMYITDSLGDDGSFDRSASLVLENARSYSVDVDWDKQHVHLDVHPDYRFDVENKFFRFPEYYGDSFYDGLYSSICCDLLTLSFDEGITEIPDYFGENGQVHSYNLPQSLERIGSHAFYNNDVLDSITIPDNVSYIYNSAFSDCDRLQKIVIPQNSDLYIGEQAFRSCDRLKNVRLPKSCKELQPGLFELCHALDSIDFPTDLTLIGLYAFYGCDSLFYKSGTLVLPEGVQTIGSFAFAQCRHINKVVLPKSTKSVGNSAFMWIGSENANVEDLWNNSIMKLDSIVFDCFASEPPVIEGNFSEGVFYHRSSGKARLNVPARSVEKYKNSSWADDFDIYALDPALDPETSYNPVSSRADLNIEVRNGVVSVSGADN